MFQGLIAHVVRFLQDVSSFALGMEVLVECWYYENSYALLLSHVIVIDKLVR